MSGLGSAVPVVGGSSPGSADAKGADMFKVSPTINLPTDEDISLPFWVAECNRRLRDALEGASGPTSNPKKLVTPANLYRARI